MNQSTESTPIEPSSSAPPPPEDRVDDLTAQLGEAYALVVYANYTKKVVKPKPLKDQGIALINGLKPRDDIERMLIGQMLLAHARNLLLSRKLPYLNNADVTKQMHASADDASATFRKTLEALKDYRRPKRRRRTSFTAIRTAHISAGQIVSGKKKKPQALEAKHESPTRDQPSPEPIDVTADQSEWTGEKRD